MKCSKNPGQKHKQVNHKSSPLNYNITKTIQHLSKLSPPQLMLKTMQEHQSINSDILQKYLDHCVQINELSITTVGQKSCRVSLYSWDSPQNSILFLRYNHKNHFCYSHYHKFFLFVTVSISVGFPRKLYPIPHLCKTLLLTNP